MATPAELAALIEVNVTAALAMSDPRSRSAALAAIAADAYELAWADVGENDPATVPFVDSVTAAIDATEPDPDDAAQSERVSLVFATAAVNAAAVAAAGPDTELTWVTMLDDRVREMHQPLHGETISAGGTWNVGGFPLHYPGEPVGPPEVWINCRCTTRVGVSAGATYSDSRHAQPDPDAICDEGQHLDPDTGQCVADDDELVARTFTTDQRKAMASRHTAMPDGSYPISTIEDLRNAIQAIGRAKNPDAVKAHIRRRARALGATNLIPESWSASATAASPPGTHDAPGWLTHPRETQRLRNYWTRGAGAAKIRWGSPGDLTRCEKHLRKYVGPQWSWGTCQNLHHTVFGFYNPESRGRRGGGDPDEIIDRIDAAFTAAAALEEPMEMLAPPLEWFQQPEFDEPTPLTITSDGRVLGHLASWDTCHVGISGDCITPPHSQTNYAHFRTGEVETREGTLVAVGQITMDTGHAGEHDGPQAAVSHYDNTGTGVADVAVGEDEFGIWVAGAMRPGVSEQQMYVLKATGALSGDWRRIGGNLELVAALAVNVPGFPVPRIKLAASASGAPLSLVAAAVVTVDPNALDADRVAVAVVARMEQRDAERARLARAAALADTIHDLRVEALTAAAR